MGGVFMFNFTLMGEGNTLIDTTWGTVQLPPDGLYCTNDESKATELQGLGLFLLTPDIKAVIQPEPFDVKEIVPDSGPELKRVTHKPRNK
jgi:hypothetical protein